MVPANIFGYFENLFLLRDLEKIEQEKARLKNFNVMLDAVGHQEELYDMFVQATMELLHKVYQEIESGSYDDTFLVDAFNDEYNATAIIQHFRVSHLSARVVSFLANLISVDDQCVHEIEPRQLPGFPWPPPGRILPGDD